MVSAAVLASVLGLFLAVLVGLIFYEKYYGLGVAILIISMFFVFLGSAVISDYNQGILAQDKGDFKLKNGRIYEVISAVKAPDTVAVNGWLVILRLAGESGSDSLRVYLLYENPPAIFVVSDDKNSRSRYVPYTGNLKVVPKDEK